MNDADFAEMVRLIHEYGTEAMDQFDHFRVGPLFVYIGLEPGWPGSEPIYRDLTP